MGYVQPITSQYHVMVVKADEDKEVVGFPRKDGQMVNARGELL